LKINIINIIVLCNIVYLYFFLPLKILFLSQTSKTFIKKIYKKLKKKKKNNYKKIKIKKKKIKKSIITYKL